MGKRRIVQSLFGLIICSTTQIYGATPPLNEKESLGKSLFFETRLSNPDGQSCASCHAASAGFTDPFHVLPVSRGVLPLRFGSRSAPTAAYSKFSPPLFFDKVDGTYVGGLFWDGRADTLEQQAQGPFLNPLEMHNANREQVIGDIARSPLAAAFKKVYGQQSLDPANTNQAYLQLADAIATYERSQEVSPFTSKFDYYLKGQVKLTNREARGLALFNGKANCFACHPSTVQGNEPGPLFTDFTYDNIGIPKNWLNPYLYMSKDLNPDGIGFIDYGLQKTVASFDPDASDQAGRFKVPTLRNLELSSPYGHNGYFFTIKQIVHFYNTRDVPVALWPQSEVPQTVNHDELGDLGLTNEEEDDLILFLRTLTDGFVLPAASH